MPSVIGSLPVRAALQQDLQLTQVIHAQAMEVAPAGDSKQVVDDYSGIAFAGQTLVAGQLLGSLFGFVMVVVGVEKFHKVLRLGFYGIIPGIQRPKHGWSSIGGVSTVMKHAPKI